MATLGADELVCENQGGEVIWSFSFLLFSPCLKKNVGGVRGRVGEEKGFICFRLWRRWNAFPPVVCSALGQLQAALLVTLTLTSCDYPFSLRGNSGSILARMLGGPLLLAGAWWLSYILRVGSPTLFSNWILLSTHLKKKINSFQSHKATFTEVRSNYLLETP